MTKEKLDKLKKEYSDACSWLQADVNGPIKRDVARLELEIQRAENELLREENEKLRNVSLTIAEKYNWAKENTEFDVEETRKLAASHGKDGLIIIAWRDNGDGTVKYNTTTAGKNRLFAMQAASIRDWVMSMIGGSDGKPIRVEDKINEHTD